MGQRYAAAGAEASLGAARSCSETGKPLPLISAVMRLARTLWPSKTALELASRTGASERMCRYWMSERFDISAEHLAELLRSDAGLAVLEALMGEARPDWWRGFKRQVSLAAARREAQAALRRVAELEARE
jgi:hypothetical protein